MAGVLDAVIRWLKSPAFKVGLIGFLILLLMIPLLMVSGLVGERETRARSVATEVARTWGPDQHVLGPFLIVPYTIRVETFQGDRRIETFQERRAVFTPETLQIEGRATARTLRRSIFEIPVYGAQMKLSGRFAAPRITDVVADAATVRWRDAIVVLALSGVSGLKEQASLQVVGAGAIPFAPSVGFPSNTAGMHAHLGDAGAAVLPDPDKPPAAFAFAVDLTFNGSISLDFAPVARETRVALASDWPHPSFAGALLPEERRVTPTGFTASWKVPHLARSVPESWVLNEGSGGIERLAPYAFGVRLVSPVDFYSLVNRATKYALMFLTLAFLSVFCLEFVGKRPVHAVQYLFTGIALVFFYVLLLSLAEHIGFDRAYGLAAVATSTMLATYLGAILGSRRWGGIMLAVFAVTYLLLYFILQLEDYALLAGALVGFAALTAVMFVTLRVDWSGSNAQR